MCQACSPALRCALALRCRGTGGQRDGLCAWLLRKALHAGTQTPHVGATLLCGAARGEDAGLAWAGGCVDGGVESYPPKMQDSCPAAPLLGRASSGVLTVPDTPLRLIE
jgi:hypothetical protein